MPAGSKVGLIKVVLSVFLVASCCACAVTTSIDQRESQLQTQALNAHKNSLVLDAHADIVIPSTSPSYLSKDGSSKVAIEKLVAGGVGAVVMSLAVGPGPRTPEADSDARKVVNQKLSAVQNLIAAKPDELLLAKSVADIKAAQAQAKVALLLGFQNARSLQGNIDALDELYRAGVRIFGLSHLGHNDFTDSSRPFYLSDTKAYEVSEEHGGLSSLGVAAVKRLNDLGALVDVSQLSKAATLQTIRLSRAPVIASHSNVRAITNVTRNLSDQEIDLIGQSGGVIHVAAFGAYLVDLSEEKTLASIRAVRRKHGLPLAYSYPYELYWELPNDDLKRAFLVEMRSVIGAGSIDDMVNHIDYIVKRIGINHVGIGNDFNHGSGIDAYVDASQSLNLTAALIKRGYSQNDIIKIWGDNFLRVMGQAEHLKR